MLGEKAAVNPTSRGDIFALPGWMWGAASMLQGPPPAGPRAPAEALFHFARKHRLRKKSSAA
jgi:hypothetical protein